MIALFLAAGSAFLFAVFTTPLLIRTLRKRNIGQQIRDDGPPHLQKAGTPTMGGIVIVAGAIVGYAVAHLRRADFKFSESGVLLMALIVGCMVIGFIDDYLGIVNERNLGMRRRSKLFGQLLVGVTFVLLEIHWVHGTRQLYEDHHVLIRSSVTHLSFTRDLHWDMGPWIWGVLAVWLILSTTNAANLTDGLDGLLSGVGVLVFGVFAIIAFWQFRHAPSAVFPHAIYGVEPAQALDLMAVAGAMLGGCLGFLWWNAAPARIFMGDAGSMAIGGAMVGLALLTHTILLLPILAGLCMIETLSVIAQGIAFRGFGRRIFRMSPIHHHFELKGWPETTVTIRFWIFAGMCCAFGLGVFYADFLRIPGVNN